MCDAHTPEVVLLPGVVTGGPGGLGEVEAPEGQWTLGQFSELLGPAAQPVAEHLGVGAGRGGALADDHLFLRAVGHGRRRGSACVVVGAFPDEGVTECGAGA